MIAGPFIRDAELLFVRDMVHEGMWNLKSCSFIFPLELRLKSRLFQYLLVSLEWTLCASRQLPQVSLRGEMLITWPKITHLPRNFFFRQWIWKLDALPKIQYFLWKCFINTVPVKSLLVHRGITEEETCEACGRAADTSIHVLRDCDPAKNLWCQANNRKCEKFN